MSAINPTTSTTPAQSSASATSSTSDPMLDKDSFLKLMMVELQHQDPLQPSDPTQYINELSQMTTLEQTTNMAASEAKAATQQSTVAALQLLGHSVTYSDSSGNPPGGHRAEGPAHEHRPDAHDRRHRRNRPLQRQRGFLSLAEHLAAMTPAIPNPAIVPPPGVQPVAPVQGTPPGTTANRGGARQGSVVRGGARPRRRRRRRSHVTRSSGCSGGASNLASRRIQRLTGGIARAADKGSRDSVIFIDGTAFVVSVKNNTVITAVASERMREHVFTNIDSAVIA